MCVSTEAPTQTFEVGQRVRITAPDEMVTNPEYLDLRGSEGVVVSEGILPPVDFGIPPLYRVEVEGRTNNSFDGNFGFYADELEAVATAA